MGMSDSTKSAINIPSETFRKPAPKNVAPIAIARSPRNRTPNSKKMAAAGIESRFSRINDTAAYAASSTPGNKNVISRPLSSCRSTPYKRTSGSQNAAAPRQNSVFARSSVLLHFLAKAAESKFELIGIGELKLRIIRPHHFRGRSCYQAARRDALRFLHQAIHESGNHVRLPRRLRFQSDARHFLGRLGISERPVRLLRDFLKFRHGRTRAQRANPHSQRTHFLGNSFRKQQIERLGRRIAGTEWQRLIRRERCDDHHVAVLPLHHRRHVQPRQMHHGGTIHLNHFQHFLHGNLMHEAVRAKTGVVDQEFHLDLLIGRERVNLARRLGARQVRRENFGLDAVLRRKIGSQFLQPVNAPRREQQIRAASREQLRQFQTDPRTRPGNQRPLAPPFLLPLFRHGNLRSHHASLQRQRSTPHPETLSQHRAHNSGRPIRTTKWDEATIQEGAKAGSLGGTVQALSGFSRGITVSRMRTPCSFRRSSSRRAQTNSAASMPKASMMVSHPGPGVAIITIPSASSVNPISTLTIRFACWNELISTKSLASREWPALVAPLLAACCLDSAQPVPSRHARRFPSHRGAPAGKFLVPVRRTVGLRDASAFELARRGRRSPLMEKFCRVSGNTGPHARASGSSRTQLSGNRATPRRLELVNDAH